MFFDKEINWWLDVKDVLDLHGITNAKELEIRLSEKPPAVSYSFIKHLADANFIKDPVKETDEFFNKVGPLPETSTSTPAWKVPYPRLYEKFLKPPKPTIGRIVHFVDHIEREYPAIIINVVHPDSPSVYLYVFSQYKPPYEVFVPQDEEWKRKLTWHWPDQEKED